ncbi:hypothetical protein BDW22DRAFT_1431646 [Trametopsis cervina]|nr:hypothetical protein BDW22DRAFT_1431646 [Trametopsis cervina]
MNATSHSPIYYVGQPSVMRTHNAARIKAASRYQTQALHYKPSPSPSPSPPPSHSHSHSPSPQSDVPTAVSTLLGLTKQLQDVLGRWSDRAASDAQVSDAFVLVAMQFAATVDAFTRHRIDMSDLLPIPSELRSVLERWLGAGPSEPAFDRYAPRVRAVLVRLLVGLRQKQAPYWRAVGGEEDDASAHWGR